MALAFDHAWDRFVVPGIPIEADRLRPILAQHIVEMVRRGERDLDRISKGGLVRLREVAFGRREPSRLSKRQLRRELARLSRYAENSFCHSLAINCPERAARHSINGHQQLRHFLIR